MDSVNSTMAVASIIGFINGLQFALDGQWKSFAKFGAALVLGCTFGYLNWFGIKGIEAGLGLALTSSGIFKLTQNLGLKKYMQV